MIFSGEHDGVSHIDMIMAKVKVQTRRQSDRYRPYHLYAIQPKRTAKGLPKHKILIICKWRETPGKRIGEYEAKAEGNYTPDEYERLYSDMYPGWTERWAYHFKLVTQEEI